MESKLQMTDVYKKLIYEKEQDSIMRVDIIHFFKYFHGNIIIADTWYAILSRSLKTVDPHQDTRSVMNGLSFPLQEQNHREINKVKYTRVYDINILNGGIDCFRLSLKPLDKDTNIQQIKETKDISALRGRYLDKIIRRNNTRLDALHDLQFGRLWDE